jgi:hypothetical protein
VSGVRGGATPLGRTASGEETAPGPITQYAPIVNRLRRHTHRVDAPTMQLLEWIAEGPRTYSETLEAWRSSCPTLTVWEDALADGLVRVERGAVVLTPAASLRLQTRPR